MKTKQPFKTPTKIGSMPAKSLEICAPRTATFSAIASSVKNMLSISFLIFLILSRAVYFIYFYSQNRVPRFGCDSLVHTHSEYRNGSVSVTQHGDHVPPCDGNVTLSQKLLEAFCAASAPEPYPVAVLSRGKGYATTNAGVFKVKIVNVINLFAIFDLFLPKSLFRLREYQCRRLSE